MQSPTVTIAIQFFPYMHMSCPLPFSFPVYALYNCGSLCGYRCVMLHNSLLRLVIREGTVYKLHGRVFVKHVFSVWRCCSALKFVFVHWLFRKCLVLITGRIILQYCENYIDISIIETINTYIYVLSTCSVV